MFVRSLVAAALLAVAQSPPQDEPPTSKEQPAAQEKAPPPFFDGNISSTGRADARMTAFDQAMRDFLRQGGIPGATLAISKDGRMVYSRGFGYSDFDAKVPMQPNALMRIASLSKPVTSTMVLLLAQDEKLEVSDPILSRLDPKLHRGRAPQDARWGQITLLQLLRHRAGFDRKISGDPVFFAMGMGGRLSTRHAADKRDVISAVLRRPLDFAPGKNYAYSNIGYSLLGRAIEFVTEKDYELAVKERLLLPLGIRDMHVGRTLRKDALPNEVVYHSTERVKSKTDKNASEWIPAPYGAWAQPDLDACGGWVASAPALLRLSSIYDADNEASPLNSKSIELMFAHPDGKTPKKGARPWYGCGWEVRSYGNGHYSAWHAGLLPGTASLWVMRPDGLSWVVLFNARADEGDNYLSVAIDPRLHEAAMETTAWPEFDLFEKGTGEAPKGPIRTK